MKLETKRMICLLIVITSIIAIVGTVSFAYFTSVANPVTQEASISTGTTKVTFADGDLGMSGTLSFGDSVTKKFTITNTGTTVASVKLYWKDLVNTYTTGSLTYTLSYSETENGTYKEVVGKKNVPSSSRLQMATLVDKVTIPVGGTYYYNLVITLNYLDDVNQDADKIASLSTYFQAEDLRTNVKPTNEFANLLLSKANDENVTDYNSGNKQEMFVFDHEITNSYTYTEYTEEGEEETYTDTCTATQIEDWTDEERRDYRYIGSEPNNYITFNDETWRIIGVFTVETETGEKEQLVKIVREESIGSIDLDPEQHDTRYSSPGWIGTAMQIMLNGDYYNKESFTYKNGSNEITINGLNSKSRGQVAKVKWYLGSENYDGGITVHNYYSSERGIKGCMSFCDKRKDVFNVVQNIGFIYVTDYMFTYADGVNDKCYDDGRCNSDNAKAGWLYNGAYQWTLSQSLSGITILGIRESGAIILAFPGNFTELTYSTRPSLYLNSSIKIIDGDGSAGNPYTIG